MRLNLKINNQHFELVTYAFPFLVIRDLNKFEQTQTQIHDLVKK